MRILTVDDDDNALQMLNLLLTEAGYEVVSARNGREAMAILRTGDCQLVVTDWEMPVMNGLDALRRMRALNPALATIVITGAARDTAWPPEIGRYWMPKPLIPRKLLELIRLLLSGPQVTGSPA